MPITATLLNQSDDENLRYLIPRTAEGVPLFAYTDSDFIPTIGLGFNLRALGSHDGVFAAFGIGPQFFDNTVADATLRQQIQTKEAQYIAQLNAADRCAVYSCG